MAKKKAPAKVKKQETQAVVPEEAIQNFVAEVVSAKGGGIQETMCLYSIFGISTDRACELLKVPRSTAFKWMKKLTELPKLGETLERYFGDYPSKYRLFWRSQLPRIAKAELAALRELEADPKLVVKQPALLRQLRAVAGVAVDDEAPRQTINIAEMRMMVSELVPNVVRPRLPDAKVIDARVVDQSDDE